MFGMAAFFTSGGAVVNDPSVFVIMRSITFDSQGVTTSQSVFSKTLTFDRLRTFGLLLSLLRL